MGGLGVALPVVVAVWGFLLLGRLEIQSSISDYYSLRTRDAFVGILFTIAWFFYAYSPYKGDPDDVAGNWACAFALGVAIFPNSGTGWDPILHFTAAFGLLSVLSYFSLCLFTKAGATKTRQKGDPKRDLQGMRLDHLGVHCADGLVLLVPSRNPPRRVQAGLLARVPRPLGLRLFLVGQGRDDLQGLGNKAVE